MATLRSSTAEARLPAFAADPINSAGGFIPVAGQQQQPRVDSRSSSPTRSASPSSLRSCRSSHRHPRCALISAGGSNEVLRGGSGGGGGTSGGGGSSMPPAPAPGHIFKVGAIQGVLSYVNLWPKNNQVLNEGPAGAAGGGGADSGDLGVELRKRVTAVYGAHVSEDGTGVDYASLGASEEFKEYTALARKLASVNVEEMEEGEKVAFFVNTYNSLLIHAFAAMGTPGNMLSRLRLYAVASYRIGGHVYSLNDIENGILRGNTKGPTPNAKTPFGPGDPRAALACKKPDARIHFALNCGARGCPPIRFYRAEQIDKDLERASQAFCGGVEVNEESGEVGLSMIFKWYDKDFSAEGGDAGVLAWIVRNLPEGDAKRQQIEVLVKAGKARVRHLEYDWGLNKKK